MFVEHILTDIHAEIAEMRRILKKLEARIARMEEIMGD